MNVDVLFYLLVLSCLVSAGVGVISWRRRHATPAAVALAAVMAFVAIWSLAAALCHTSLNLAVQRYVLVALQVGACGLVASLFCLFRAVQERDWQLRARTLALLVVMPVATVVAVLTNPAHELFFTAVFLDGTPPTLRFALGPLYYVHTVYSYALLAFSLAMLVRACVRARGPFRRQLITILLAALVPVPGNVWVNLQGVDGSPQAPVSPAFFTISGALIAWALLRQRLMQLVPIARSRVVETIGDAMLVVDLQRRVLDVNPAAMDLIARLRPEAAGAVIGMPVDQIATAGIVSALEGDHFEGLVEVQPGLHLDVRTTAVHDRKGALLGSILLAHDVSDMHNQRLALAEVNRRMAGQLATIEKLRAELAEEAIRDSLTGLYNRRHLMRTMQSSVGAAHASAAQMSVLLIDIDHFKRVNDSYGHLVGDQALTAVARCLSSQARVGDTVARMGGEEFVILMPGAGLEQAGRRAETIRRACADLVLRAAASALLPDGSGSRILPPITISIGICAMPEHGQDAESLLAAADRALYAAKAAGRNRVVPARAEPAPTLAAGPG